MLPFTLDPTFKINLGLAPDLSNNSLFRAHFFMNPGDLFEWTVVNSDAVDVSAGVRMTGYIDYTETRANERFGG